MTTHLSYARYQWISLNCSQFSKQRRKQNFYLGGGGGWPWGYIQFLFGFKNYVRKIMSKSPNLYLVRLQGKIKSNWKTKKYPHIHADLLHFSILQCTSHQPIAVADLDWSVNHVIPLCAQMCLFFYFALGEWGVRGRAAARQPLPPGVPMIVES